MKVAIPSDTGDVNGPVSPIFGRCRYFIIFTVDNGNITGTQVLENSAWAQRGGAGITAAQLLVNNGVNAIIAYSIGPRAVSVLGPAGVKMYRAIPGSAEENVKAYIVGSLEEGIPPGPGYGMRGGGFGRGRGYGRGYGRGFGRSQW